MDNMENVFFEVFCERDINVIVLVGFLKYINIRIIWEMQQRVIELIFESWLVISRL